MRLRRLREGAAAGRCHPGRRLYPAASWLLTLAALAAVWVANGRSDWLAGSLLRYLALMLSMAASLAISLRRPVHVVAALPIVAAAAFMTVPEVGYGGQIAALAAGAALGSGGLAAGGVALGRTRPRPRLLVGLVAVQLLIVALGLGLTGSFGLLARIQHDGGTPVEVRSVCLSCLWESGCLGRSRAQRLSLPYAGEHEILIVSEAGDLHRLDSMTLQLLDRISLPRLDPADYSLVSVMPEGRSEAALPWLAQIRPLGGGRFTVAYPLAAEKPALGEGPAQPFWRVEVDVDLGTGQVLRASVVEGEVKAGWGIARPVEVGGLSVVWGDLGNSLRVTGEGIDTRIWPWGNVNWIEVAGPEVFIGTDCGRLYLVTPPGSGGEASSEREVRSVEFMSGAVKPLGNPACDLNLCTYLCGQEPFAWSRIWLNISV